MPAWLTDTVTTLFRVVVGFLFMIHGASTLFGVFGGHMGSGASLPAGTWPGWWAALIQFAGGLLVIGGLATRVTAAICSGSMAYAYFVVHQPDALLPLQNQGELAVMFCWSFLLVAALGPGRWSVDDYIRSRRERTS